jgi:hypothetical protein
MKTKSWFCDKCSGPIQEATDGWVQWIEARQPDDTRRGRDLQLVHHLKRACRFDAAVEKAKDGGSIRDDSLREFLGADGLTRLLGLIVEGNLPTLEIVRMIQRLHTPGYEQARPYFTTAIADGLIEPNLEEGFYWNHQLQEILENYV